MLARKDGSRARDGREGGSDWGRIMETLVRATKELVRLDPKVNGKPLKCLLWVAGEGGSVGNIIILGFRVTENRSWSLSWR